MAGDAVVFMRRADGELLAGIRRAPRYPAVSQQASEGAERRPRNARAGPARGGGRGRAARGRGHALHRHLLPAPGRRGVRRAQAGGGGRADRRLGTRRAGAHEVPRRRGAPLRVEQRRRQGRRVVDPSIWRMLEVHLASIHPSLQSIHPIIAIIVWLIDGVHLCLVQACLLRFVCSAIQYGVALDVHHASDSPVKPQRSLAWSSPRCSRPPPPIRRAYAATVHGAWGQWTGIAVMEGRLRSRATLAGRGIRRSQAALAITLTAASCTN